MATTTNYSWTTPDNTAYVKDGASAIRTLGSSVDTTLFTALGGAYPGLRLIKKQTIGTGVSSVAVTSAFSATYENYKIVVSGGTATSSDALGLQLTGLTANYRHQFIYGSYSSTLTGNGSIGNSNWPYVGFHSTAYLDMNVDLRNPFLAKPTIMTAVGIAGSTYSGTNTGLQADSTSVTGFTITMGAAGTMTGGTIYVYGYGAS